MESLVALLTDTDELRFFAAFNEKLEFPKWGGGNQNPVLDLTEIDPSWRHLFLLDS